MKSLCIYLFGTVRLTRDGESAPTSLIHGVQALLAYLVLYRERLHRREVLSGLFWGEHNEARARSCLSTALWRLRQVLEPPGVTRGTYLVVTRGGEIGFNRESDYWLDIAAFEEGVRQLKRASNGLVTDLAPVEQAFARYSADLLDGFYNEWALRERERLRLLYLDGLARLLECHAAAGNVERALACGTRILEMDPLREEIHREVIRLHLRAGRRALAVQQFQLCRDLLAAELGVDPMPETQALLQGVAPGSSVMASLDLPTAARLQLLGPLQRIARNLDVVREQVRRAVQLIDSDKSDSGA